MGCGGGGEGRELQDIFDTPMEVAPSRSQKVALTPFLKHIHRNIIVYRKIS
jgi:hypothetical protein